MMPLKDCRDGLTKNKIQELFYILPIENLKDVLNYGILSHNRAKGLQHSDISNNEVQNLRGMKKIKRADKEKPKLLSIHRHVNLYLNPHNAMMYVKREHHNNLCVLRIHPDILERGDVMFSTKNASVRDAAFFGVDEKPLLFSPRSAKFIMEKSSMNLGQPTDKKQIRQAEILCPYKVSAEFICGIFVSSDACSNIVKEILVNNSRLDVIVDIHPSIFFYKTDTLKSFVPLKERLSESNITPSLNMELPSSDADSSGEEQETIVSGSKLKSNLSATPDTSISSSHFSILQKEFTPTEQEEILLHAAEINAARKIQKCYKKYKNLP